MSKTNKVTHKLYNDEEEIVFYPDSHRYKIPGQRTYLISNTSVTGIVSTYGKTEGLKQWAVNAGCDYMQEYVDESDPDEMFSGEEIKGLIQDARYRHKEDLEKAASLGDEVHGFAEEFARRKVAGEELTDDMLDFEDERALSMAESFLDWVSEHNVEFVEAERLAYSKKRGYVGTFDALAYVDGVLTLIDYKTSKRVYDSHQWQTAGYWQSRQEEADYTEEMLDGEPLKIEQAMVVRFDKDPEKDAEFSAENNIWTMTPETYPMYLELFNNALEVKKTLKKLNRM